MTRSDAKAGDRIAERYVLEAEIGQGGMGRVFRARDVNLSRAVAVKILLPQYAVQEASRKRFIREAKVTATLTHASAIRIFDFGIEGDCLYLVMELLGGRTLRSELSENVQLAPERAIAIVAPIVDVLCDAHAVRLIHRDLKPENVMFEDRESGLLVKVLDFGMAFIDDDAQAAAEGMGRLTKEGLSGGTPTYMSPEQVQGAPVTAAVDIYALGCILFEMLTGEPPFDGPMMKLLTKHMYQPAPDVRDLCPEAPQSLVELVDRMLKKRPGDRPTAETVRTRLAALATITDGGRERSRDRAFLSAREDRMVAAAVVPRPSQSQPPPSIVISVVGDLDGDLTLALAASGVALAAEPKDASVLFVASITDVDLPAVCGSELPVVVASTSTAIADVSELLRAGVAEIVSIPISPEELTKKLRRAHRNKR